MLAADDFLEPARRRGLRFFTGVPCSYLTPLINRALSSASLEYVGAANEGEAVALAAGAWLAGTESVVMCQNSGLGNMVNPLTSLNHTFKIPALLIVSWRGQPGFSDAPQHRLMGAITPQLLELLRVPHALFPTQAPEVVPVLDEACASMADTGLPFALIMTEGSVRDTGLDERTPSIRPKATIRDLRTAGRRPSRHAALERFLGVVPETAAVIATTGKCGRELFTLADRPQQLYQVGSMGCAGALGLGVALHSSRAVHVLDGDGALLMHLGLLSTVGAQAPENLVHIVLDNGVHDSTGGQRTDSATIDLACIARAAGYARVARCDDLTGFETSLAKTTAGAGPYFIHLQIRPGSLARLGRPTIEPPAAARRFRAFLASAE